MAITAAMVKELRERTGAGMMDCKKALTEANGDLDAAIEDMRKSGAAKAVKKAGRIAAEGQVAIAVSENRKKAAVVEVNCETDFVTKDDSFNRFTEAVTNKVLESGVTDIAQLIELTLGDGATVEKSRQDLVAKIGENIQLRRAEYFETSDGLLGSYRHGTRIGVVTELLGGDEALSRDISMHIAASRPVCVDEKQVPAELLANERKIFTDKRKKAVSHLKLLRKWWPGVLKNISKRSP